MKCLVTGGAGFIGSHLVSSLLQEGAHVLALDNFTTGRRENLDTGSASLEILHGDVRDAQAVYSALSGVEIVFHQAAFVSVPQSMELPQECFDVNVTGTSVLLEAAREQGVRRVVVASSAAVYGNSTALPLYENSELKPLSPYAASKRVDEIYGQLYSTALGLEVVALRYFNVYGPRQRPDSAYAAAVPIFIRRLLDGKPITIFGDGGQTRDLISVRDAVRANLIASTHPAAVGQVFNICTGVETRLLDVLEILYRLIPGSAPENYGDPRSGDIYRSVGSPDRAAAMIGFRPEVSLEQGLRETVAWMRA